MDTPVTGAPRGLLRLEGLVAFAAGVVAYRMLGGSWITFAALFLVPDVSLLGYFVGARVGAVSYNIVHTYLAPGGLAAFALFRGRPELWPICAIWITHIGVDRALGLGLKYAAGFGFTHLGPVGRVAPET